MKTPMTKAEQPTSFRLRTEVLQRAQKKARATGDSLAEVVETSLDKYAKGGFRLGACDHLQLKDGPFPVSRSPIPLKEWGALAR